MQSNFPDAMAVENPLQIAGVINAYAAIQAQKAGFNAIYISGSGVATASYGLRRSDGCAEDYFSLHLAVASRL